MTVNNNYNYAGGLGAGVDQVVFLLNAGVIIFLVTFSSY